ncbi:polar amino acid transport system substrate-binding protein [Inquilinus ginsengisoli]|uniref:Polar amino acid transport system substrate-binding protein n=1 Tax=Inquilinus ginsengisoli TaxID=363840 RepID=A0ABU1JN40_9PROT|nr:ABC transporter substrate-binding protein [Inquilinus ginsengisoli]MDR6290023.1 polar amino acid transport system substrate-binding protein [Inquilinus ginsengisoli]
MSIRRNAAAAAIGIAALLTAFGAAAQTKAFDLSPEQAGRVHTTRIDAAAASIPAGFKFVKDGVFTVGVSVGDPPLNTYATDAKTVIGTDADLASLVAEGLGRKVEFVPVAWDDWPLGLTSGKFDAVISNVTVTEERKQRFDFSSYRQDVLGAHVALNSPIKSIKEPKDIAGLKVIVGAGTNQEKIVLEWNRQNVAAGLKPAEFLYFEDNGASLLALQSGRADVEVNPNSRLAYSAAVGGKTRQVGVINGGWPLTAEIAITTRKGSGLADALTAAINGLIANGKYAEALARWNLTAEAVAQSRTNPPGLPKV